MNRCKSWIKRTVVLSVTCSMLSLGWAGSAGAAVIGTGDVIAAEERSELLSKMDAFLLRENVARQLTGLGASVDDAKRRAQAMTDEELASLIHNIDELPAGGGVLEVIGVVFVVLIVLELVGAIDIFKRT